jgi:hypothetical protein
MYECNGIQLDDFTRAYLEAALWAETDNSDPSGGDPLDENYDIEDFAPDSIQRAVDDCVRFQTENASTLAKYDWRHSDGDVAGHNFWLNRNGHGSGFWDEYPRVPDEQDRERLSKACDKFGGVNVEVGDDGQLHLY